MNLNVEPIDFLMGAKELEVGVWQDVRQALPMGGVESPGVHRGAGQSQKEKHTQQLPPI
jgi:hypothetical protein